MRAPQSILITGASSGIGAALAREYAAPGVQLHLGGRDMARLAAVARDCESRGAQVDVQAIDVTDAAAMADWIAAAHARAPLDLVIANAGISAGTGGGDGEPAAQVRRIFAVNLDGVLNTVLPAIPLLRDKPVPAAAGLRGQIAVVSSMAGFRGMPGAPAYSASKAAVRAWGEALRGALRDDAIGVSVIIPGFVRSGITEANDFPMPLLMSAERAAARIRAGLARDVPRIAFPLPTYFVSWLVGALPPRLVDGLLARLPDKRRSY